MKNKDLITLEAYFFLYLITVQGNGLVELRSFMSYKKNRSF